MHTTRISRETVINEIKSAWHQEIGGDVLFKAAYDAMWTNGPPWNPTPDEFFTEFQHMKRLLPRLHPKDIAVLWKASCGKERRIFFVWDNQSKEDNYDISD